MFDAHPEVLTIPVETGMFFRGGPEPEAVVRRWLMKARNLGASRLCEKTPMHVRHVDRIRVTFPGASILHIVRDGLDVVASLRRQRQTIEHACHRWVSDVRAGRAAGLPEVSYEALVAEPERTLARACHSCRLTYDPAMLRFHETRRQWFVTAEKENRARKNAQLRKPLFDGRGSYRELPEKERREAMARLGDARVELGFHD